MKQNIAPVVALDIGNVCVKLALEKAGKKFGFHSVVDLFTQIPDVNDLEIQIECGHITKQQFLQKLFTIFSGKLTIPQLEDAWLSIAGEEMQGMAEIVETILAHNLKPVFFSNISHAHYQDVSKRISFFHKIYGAILSYEVQEVKPNIGIYLAMEKQFCNGGIPALYVDDMPENIAAGKARGWNSHLFTGIKNLQQEINKLIATT